MAVQTKLSSIKSINGANLTSVVDLSNFNFSTIKSAISEFLTLTNFSQGAVVSIGVDSITVDTLQSHQGVTVYGAQLPGGSYPEVIKLDPSGSVTAKNLVVDDVIQGKRIRLMAYGLVPSVGYPGEVIYVAPGQEGLGYEEGFYGYLDTYGWKFLSGTSGTAGAIRNNPYAYTLFVDTFGSDFMGDPNSIGIVSGYEPELGNPDRPWRTVSAALTEAASLSFVSLGANYKVHVLSGDYTESDTVAISRNRKVSLHLTAGTRIKVDTRASTAGSQYWISYTSADGTGGFALSGEGIENSRIQANEIGLISFIGSAVTQDEAKLHSLTISNVSCISGYGTSGIPISVRASRGELIVNGSQLINGYRTTAPTAVIEGTSLNLIIKNSNLVLSSLSTQIPDSVTGTAGNAGFYSWVIRIENDERYNSLKIIDSTLDIASRLNDTSGTPSDGSVSGNFISFAGGSVGGSRVLENNVVLLNNVYFHGLKDPSKTLWNDTTNGVFLYIGNGITSAGAPPDGFGPWNEFGNTSGVAYSLGTATISSYTRPDQMTF